MMLKKNSGTTLIEVLVASGILVSIITLLTVALTSTFEGYSRVLSSAQVEQDAQYITARLQYATTRADRNTLVLHTTSTDFSGGAFNQTETTTSSDGEVGLSGSNTTGTFTSAPITLASDETVRSFTSSTSLPANTSIGYQIGVRSPIASVCSTNSSLYGYALDTTGAAPIAWYKMDETTWNGTAGEVVNSTTNSYDATSSGGAYTTAAGKYGRAGIFDGVDDYVRVTDTPAFNRTTGQEMTVEAWIKPGRLAGYYQDIVASRSSGTYNWMLYQHEDDGSVQLHGSVQNKSTYVPAIDTWTHIAATVNSSGSYTLYANGVVVQGPQAYTYSLTTPNELSIGNFGTDEYYLGAIDDVRIYDYARSQANIITDMNNYQPRPASPVAWWKLDETSGASAANSARTANPGDLVDAPTWVTGKYNNALTLNGSSQYVSITDDTVLNAGQMTWMAWVNPTDYGAARPFYNRRTAGNVGGVTGQFDSSGHLDCYAYISGSWRQALSPGVVTAGSWSHVACSYDGSNLRAYINGSNVTTTPIAGSINTPTSPSVEIGRDIPGAGYIFNGKIDDVRVYNYARTAVQIADDMNGVDPINVVDYFTLPTGTYGLPTPSPTPNFSNPGQCIIYITTYTRSSDTDTSPQTLDVTIKK